MNKSKISNLSAFIAAGVHLFCCGVPFAAATLGVAAPFAGILPHGAKYALLGFAAIATAVSWIFYLKGCRRHKKLLLFSTFMFAAAIFMTFALPHITGGGCQH